MGACNSKGSQYRKEQIEEIITNNGVPPIHKGSILGVIDTTCGLVTCSDDTRVGVIEKRLDGSLASKFSYLDGHKKAVNKASSRGNILWTASRDLGVKQWNMETMSLLHSFDNIHELNISSVVAQFDGKAFFTGSRDYKVKKWDVEKQMCVAEYSAPRNIVTTMDVHSQGEPMLYQGSEDLCIRVWDTRAAQRTPAVHIKGYVYFPLSISLAPNGLYLATGCKGFEGVGCEVKLWDLRNTRQQIVDFKGHFHDVTGCKFTADSQRIVSASKDGTIFAWDASMSTVQLNGSVSESRLASFQSEGKNFTSLALSDPESGSLDSSGPTTAVQTLAIAHVGAFDGSLSTVLLRNKKQSTGEVDFLLHSTSTPFYTDNPTDRPAIDNVVDNVAR